MEDQGILSDEEKERIRAEEIHRTEIRQELESKGKMLDFLSSPLGIWLLSAVVVSLLPFVYSELSKRNSERLTNEREATRVFFEAQFRMKQMDRALSMVENPKEQNSEASVLRLAVAVRLGGIVSFPLNDEYTVWVSGSGQGNRFLPYGRGFQNERFSGYGLLNLWYSYHISTCGCRPPEKEVTDIDILLHELDEINFSEGESTERLIEKVKKLWDSLRKKFEVFLRPGPQFDLRDHCVYAS